MRQNSLRKHQHKCHAIRSAVRCFALVVQLRPVQVCDLSPFSRRRRKFSFSV
jgi:hypothetical protein